MPPENSVAFYLALRKAGVPAELHVYERGKHGVGLAPSDPVLSTWAQRLADWLRVRGLLAPPRRRGVNSRLGGNMSRITELHCNGRRVKLPGMGAEPERALLGVLRDDLDLTGTKYGCGEGQCGACTVLVDGAAVRSCITSVGSVAGKKITTIEGLERNGRLHPVQSAFLEAGALQCGYCTPGMIMSGVALVAKNRNPAPAEIAAAMQGNVCRCGTYPRIVKAIQAAARGGAR